MGNLIQARARVTWGQINLTSYDGSLDFPKGNPLVYDVEMSMQSETQSPTASMKWDPTGPGYAVYESFISDENLMKTPIVIEFFYPGGKHIVFPFIWTGQSIVYGNEMTVTVNMQSELAGLINANPRNVANTDTSKTGIDSISAVKYLQKQYGLEKFKDLVKWNGVAEKDMKRAKIETQYATDSTFGAALGNIAQQTGNTVFAHNIGKAGLVIFAPFTWDKTQVVYDGVSDISPGTLPDPLKRYGYFIGPSMINSMTRVSEWKPPQVTNSKNPSQLQTRGVPSAQNYGANTQRVPSQPLISTTSNLTSTRAPIGTSSGRSTPGIGNKDNPDQIDKQNALNAEKSSTMNLSTYLVPALVGIKPYDIVYVPSLKGEFIEDWIVQSVDYNQNDGKIEVSIQASRVYGLAGPMNEKEAEKFRKVANSLGLVGTNWTLESWDAYAWVTYAPPSPQDQINANYVASGDSF